MGLDAVRETLRQNARNSLMEECVRPMVAQGHHPHRRRTPNAERVLLADVQRSIALLFPRGRGDLPCASRPLPPRAMAVPAASWSVWWQQPAQRAEPLDPKCSRSSRNRRVRSAH